MLCALGCFLVSSSAAIDDDDDDDDGSWRRISRFLSSANFASRIFVAVVWFAVLGEGEAEVKSSVEMA